MYYLCIVSANYHDPEEMEITPDRFCFFDTLEKAKQFQQEEEEKNWCEKVVIFKGDFVD